MSANLFIVECQRIGKRKAYKLTFPINDQIFTRIKELPENNRKWNTVDKFWEVTIVGLFQLIKQYRGSTKIKFDFGGDKNRQFFIENIKKIEEDIAIHEAQSKELIEKKQKWVDYKIELETTWDKYSDEIHKHLKPNVKLFPYQIVGVMFLKEVRNVLLALDMGLGKTLQSISYSELCGFKKVFVITPNSLKHNYYGEVEKFTYSKAHIVGWNKNKYSLEESKYIIVNYDFFNNGNFKQFEAKFKKLRVGKIDCLICDESHKIANETSNTTKNFKKTFKDDIFKNKSVSKIFMSGTPIPSKVQQLYTVLNQISPIEFATKKHFFEYYCGLVRNPDGFGWDVNYDSTKYEELFQKISPFMYRKKKNEVLKDLPEVTIQKVYLEMTQSELEIYNQIEEGVANEFCQETIFNPLTIMLKLKQYTSELKTKAVSELIDSVLEFDEKFVIVDFFKESLGKLKETYGDIAVLHTGDVKTDVRAKMVSDFQNDPSIKLFIGSQPTVTEGLTLTAASKIGILTIPWNPGDIDQIYSRLQRIGQKNAVNVYLFVYRDTIDEYIISIVEKKSGSISQVIDGKEYVSKIEDNIMGDLIQFIKQKHGK